MDSNLDGKWKTDADKETEGTWVPVSDGVDFKVKRFGGRNSLNIKEAYSRGKRKGDKETEEDTARQFVNSCLSGWRGVKANGEELPFSEENAVNLLVDLPDLLDYLFDYAKEMDNFKVDMGNA